jgi:uncharacterized repeat protein (TIGR01451 family)/uncharacterized repeat protein (TIGR02543 family)
MFRKTLKSCMPFVLLLIMAVYLQAEPVFAATGNEALYPDQPEYMMGDTTLIHGTGFDPNYPVTVQVVRVDGSIVTGNGSETPGSDTVTTDANGDFSYNYLLDGGPESVYNGTLTVNAIDANDSTVLATTTFLDNPQYGLQGCQKMHGSQPHVCGDGPDSSQWAHSMDDPDMSSGDIKGWCELEDVPHRLRMHLKDQLTQSETFVITSSHDYTDGTLTGFDGASGFYVGADRDNPDFAEGELTKECTTLSSGVPTLPYGGYECVVVGPSFPSDQIQYTWYVQFNPAETGDKDKKWALYWKAHTSSQSMEWSSGVDLKSRIDYPGGFKTLPVKVDCGSEGDGTADLLVIKTGDPNPVTVGETLTYTITVTNNGPDEATGVTLTDMLPGSVTLVPPITTTQGSCDEALGVVTCDLGTLADGANATVTINVTPNSAGAIGNSAEVSSNETDPNGGNSSSTATTTVNPIQHTLTVTPAGTGVGTVTSDVGGINCGTTCSDSFASGTVVTLTATADPGSTFTGWGGDCSGTVSPTSVTITSDKTCTATFDLVPPASFTLTITSAGSGNGTVTSSPAGIDCGADCTEDYTDGTGVTLTPTADAGSTFTGWSGNADCSDGSVTMDASKGCTATFTLDSPPGPPSDTVADLVLCQDAFIAPHNATNSGESSTNSAGCNTPWGVAIDRSVTPNRVYVSDVSNHRVLAWTVESTLVNGQAADMVFGQSDFVSNQCNPGGSPAGPGTLCGPRGIAVDSVGNLYVADTANARVTVYFTPFVIDPLVPGSGDNLADRVFGQNNNLYGAGCQDPNTYTATAGSLCGPYGVAVDSAGNLYVADTGHNRVLKFDRPLVAPSPSCMTCGDDVPDWIVGQNGSYTSTAANLGGRGPSSLSGPQGVGLDSQDNLFVADTNNNRVLVFELPLDDVAEKVIGQTNFTSGGHGLSGKPTAGSLYNASGVAVDGSGIVYIADRINRRVMQYNPPLAQFGSQGVRVFGQWNATTGEGPLNTARCNYPSLSEYTHCMPTTVAVDSSGDLWAVDFGNHRVLEYGH